MIENPAAVRKNSTNLSAGAAFASSWITPERRRSSRKGYSPVIQSLVDAKKFHTPPVIRSPSRTSADGPP